MREWVLSRYTRWVLPFTCWTLLRFTRSVFLGLLACIAAPSWAQVPEGEWQPGFGSPYFRVNALTTYQGELVAAGTFSLVDGSPVNYIARWDGSTWRPLGSGTDLPVNALTVFDGALIAGGTFTLADGQPARFVARWDGSTWQALDVGLANQYDVRALAVYNNQLIAAGYLPGYEYVAHWTGTTWETLNNPTIHVMSEMTVYGGDLIVGGIYDLGGNPATLLMRWNGSTWTDMSNGLDGTIGGIVVWNGQLVVGGEFTHASGAVVNRIAVWNGSSWSPLGAGLDATVDCLGIAPDGRLVAGGDFGQAGGSPASHVAVWNGTSWSALGSGTNGPVLSVAVYLNDLIVGGDFGLAGGSPAAALGRWNGQAWSGVAGLSGGNGFDIYPEALTFFRGELFAGGWFTKTRDVSVNHIARWDGASWHPLQTGTNDGVYALAVYQDRLIAGGRFTQAGGMPVNCVAAWDGSSWSPIGSGFDRSVRALEVFGDELIAGGEFTDSGGTLVMGIARWDGVSWHRMGFGFDKPVYCLTMHAGTLVAGGAFTTGGDVIFNNKVARWNGTSWENIGSGLGSESISIRSLGVLNGDLFVGGGLPVGIKRWDGANWVLPGGGVGGVGAEVLSMTVFRGELIVGGGFLEAGGAPANSIAAWNGSRWAPLDQGVHGGVKAIAAQDEDMFVAGDIDRTGPHLAAYIGQWHLARTSDPGGVAPLRTLLRANVPNPFNPATAIRFDVAQRGPVELRIYDITGRVVRTLVRATLAADRHQKVWDGADDAGRPLPSGVYVCRLVTSDETTSRKLTLVR
jgi:hypothetical protein